MISKEGETFQRVHSCLTKFVKFRILKSFKKKSSVAQFCAIYLLDLLTTFILWQKPVLCQKLDHNPNSDSLKLEYCDQICPNRSGFDHCGRIKLCPAKHLVVFWFVFLILFTIRLLYLVFYKLLCKTTIFSVFTCVNILLSDRLYVVNISYINYNLLSRDELWYTVVWPSVCRQHVVH